MRTKIFQRLGAALVFPFVIACAPALAEATTPTADIDGAVDSPLLKRYEGSFIVSYEKLAYTDFWFRCHR